MSPPKPVASGTSSRKPPKSSRSERSKTVRTNHNVESAVTRLLEAIKKLLVALTDWSNCKVDEQNVSDVFVEMGNNFNAAVAAFRALNIDMTDLMSFPEDLRPVLERCLEEDATPRNLETHLPAIRNIITPFLQGLRSKQAIYRKLERKDDSRSQSRPEASRSAGNAPLRTPESPLVISQPKLSATEPESQPNPVPDPQQSTDRKITVFLQLGREVKKVTIDFGLSMSSLRGLFVEKFSFSPGLEKFPTIYIRDPSSGVQYELEDTDDVKENCLLLLNIESGVLATGPGSTTKGPVENLPVDVKQPEQGAGKAIGEEESGKTEHSKTVQKTPDVQSAITRLLDSIKKLLEALTDWSHLQVDENYVSDVYVETGNNFNDVVMAFYEVKIQMNDLMSFPEDLRHVLEPCLEQNATPENLEIYLPRVKNIIIHLLEGLRGKQSIYRERSASDRKHGLDSGPQKTDSSMALEEFSILMNVDNKKLSPKHSISSVADKGTEEITIAMNNMMENRNRKITQHAVALGELLLSSIEPHKRLTELLETNGWSKELVVEWLQTEYQTSTLDSTYRSKCMKCLNTVIKKYHIFPPSLFIKDVELSGRLGHPVKRGGFADIYKGTFGAKTVCLKLLRTYQDYDEQKREEVKTDFCKEVLIWTQLSHPNIVPLIGINADLFEPEFCLVSQWMTNNHIISFLKKNPGHDRLQSTCDIAAGLAYLHSLKPMIVHGDIKGANVLVDENGNCHLSDFGVSKTISQTTGLWTTTTGLKGSVRWMAPELFSSSEDEGIQNQYRSPRDIYAFGCTILEIMTGKPPFPHLNDGAVIHQVINNKARPARPVVGWCPDGVWDLVTVCWKEIHYRDLKLPPSMLTLLHCEMGQKQDRHYSSI